MRNLKKILALVLALVMSLSLVTIASADFSDAADIDYTEAVEVMAAAGILQGDGDKFDPKGTLTREQAAQMALNALVWNDSTKVYFIAGTPYTFETKTDAILYADLLGKDPVLDVSYDYASEGTLLLDVHGITRTTGSHDAAGRPATKYEHDDWKADKVFAKVADFTFNTAMKEKEIFKAIGAAGIQGTYDKYIVMDEIYINGKLEGKAVANGTYFEATNVVETPAPSKGSAENTVIVTKTIDGDNRANGTGNGVTVEIFKTATANHYVMVAINEFFGEVGFVNKADEDKGTKRSITILGIAGETFETESFKAGDKVLYTLDADGIASVKAPETISGRVSKITSAGVYTINGKDYKLSQDKIDTPTIDDNGTWYVDSCGNIIAAKSVVTTEWNYAYLINYQAQNKNSGSLVGSGVKTNEEKFQMITAAGEKVVLDGAFEVDSNGAVTEFVFTGAADDVAMGTAGYNNVLVRYTVNAAGKIDEIQKITNGTTGATGVSNLVATKDAALLGSTGKYVNDSTIFFVYESATKYAVYVGYKNIPATITASAASTYFYATKTDGTANTSLIAAVAIPVASAAAETSSNLVWFASTAKYEETTTDGTTVTYTNVYLNGVKGEITFATDPSVSAGTLYKYTTNTQTGYATLGTNMGVLSAASATTAEIKVIENGYYVTDHSTEAYRTIYTDANTKYFQVDETTKAVTEVAGLPAVNTNAYSIEQIMANGKSDANPITSTVPATVVYFAVISK